MFGKINKQIAKGEYNQQASRDIVNLNNPVYLQNKLPTYLANVILSLDKKLDITSPPRQDLPEPYKIQRKISHNDLKIYKYIVEEYGLFDSIVENIYEALESQKPGSKAKFLFSINRDYKRLKVGIINGIDKEEDQVKIIRLNSDFIFDKVCQGLYEKYISSDNKDEILMSEDIETCICCIVAKAFIDCKILEPPPSSLA